MSIDRVKIISDIVATWVGLVGLLVGGAFGLVQYIEKEQADRVKATMDLHSRFNNSVIFDLHKRLTSVWADRLDQLVSQTESAAVTPDGWPKYVNTVVLEERLGPEVAALVDFYEAVQICAENKVCDRSTAYAFFGVDARRFYLLHLPYIEQLRNKRKDLTYGRKLEAFVQQQTQASSAPK